MKTDLFSDLLFEIQDVFGTKVRTTKTYWKYIRTIKHADLSFQVEQLKETLQFPDEVYTSVQDPHIKLFYRIYENITLVVVVKYIEVTGFVITVYQTSKAKRKGEKLWPK